MTNLQSDKISATIIAPAVTVALSACVYSAVSTAPRKGPTDEDSLAEDVLNQTDEAAEMF